MCLSSLALFGLSRPVTAQDSSVRSLTPPPVARMFRIGPNVTPAASATLSTLNPIVREPRGLASCGEVGLDLDITYTESTIYDPATDHLDRLGLRSYAMLASQRHPKCLPMIRAAQARRKSRIFRIVSTRPIFIRTGFGSVPREIATMFWSTSRPA